MSAGQCSSVTLHDSVACGWFMKRDNGLSIYKSWYGTTWPVKRVINIHPTVILWFTFPRVSLLFGSCDDYSSVARLSFNWHRGAKNLWQNYLTKCMSHQLNLSSLEEVVLRELFEWLTDDFHDAFPLSRLYTPWLLSRHVLKLSPFSTSTRRKMVEQKSVAQIDASSTVRVSFLPSNTRHKMAYRTKHVYWRVKGLA